MNLSPGLTQRVVNCPVTCELTSTDPFEPVSYFSDLTGDLTISTQSPLLNGQTYTYSIECISELSLTQYLPAVQTFDVTFAFEQCNSAILLNGASMPNYELYWF